MLRNLILALLFVCVACEVTEARGRNRGRRYQSNSYSRNYTNYRSNVVYSNTASRNVGSQNYVNGYQPVQSVSYNNTSRVMTTYGNSMQAWAEEEARLMASRGTCGHVRGAPAGYFVGVGCGTTCVGSGRLVAEAHYQGKMVRVWQR